MAPHGRLVDQVDLAGFVRGDGGLDWRRLRAEGLRTRAAQQLEMRRNGSLPLNLSLSLKRPDKVSQLTNCPPYLGPPPPPVKTTAIQYLELSLLGRSAVEGGDQRALRTLLLHPPPAQRLIIIILGNQRR